MFVTRTKSTIELCSVTALFGVFLEKNKHLNLMRPRGPSQAEAINKSLIALQDEDRWSCVSNRGDNCLTTDWKCVGSSLVG